MSDLVGNPEDRFSQNEAQIISLVSRKGPEEEGNNNGLLEINKIFNRTKMGHFINLISSSKISKKQELVHPEPKEN